LGKWIFNGVNPSEIHRRLKVFKGIGIAKHFHLKGVQKNERYH
jgi:hypothetical protein